MTRKLGWGFIIHSDVASGSHPLKTEVRHDLHPLPMTRSPFSCWGSCEGTTAWWLSWPTND